MRIKVCGIKSEKDIEVVVKSGADAAGFLVGQLHPSPDFILPSTARRLVAKLPPYIMPVLVTQLSTADEIMELVSKSEINTVQIHGDISIEELKKLRSLISVSGKIILAANIFDETRKADLEDYYTHINAILLDSCNPVTKETGGTGLTHDWNISADFVSKCPLPVILAGGIGPENVVAAIKKVRPFAVDANTKLKNSDGERDLALCTKFVKNAQNAEDVDSTTTTLEPVLEETVEK